MSGIRTPGVERIQAADENIGHSTRSTEFMSPHSNAELRLRDAVLELTDRALNRAEEYVALLRRARTEPGLITFNAFIAGLARSNLRILAEHGLGAKLSRSQVASVAAEVVRDLAPPTLDGLGLSNVD